LFRWFKLGRIYENGLKGEEEVTKKTRNILILAFGLPMIGIGIFAAKFLINVHNWIEIDRTVATKNSINDIQKAIQIYQMQHNGRGPAAIEELTHGTEEKSPLLKSDCLVDAWRTPFRLEKNGRAWTITSAGSDKKFGTQDDLTNNE
jgi:hypothetical protein